MDLSGWDFSGADLSEWNLSKCKFNGAIFYDQRDPIDDSLKTDLRKSNLQDAEFEGAEMSYADLGGTNIFRADFKDSTLIYTAFDFCQGRLSHFENANLGGADFTRSNLEGSFFTRAHLSESIFDKSNLNEANFEYSNLKGASLNKAKMRDANLRYTEMNSKTEVQGIDWFNCVIDGSTLYYTKVDEIVVNERKFNRGKKNNDRDQMIEQAGEAREVYVKLKNHFKQAGQYETSGKYYYREKLMESHVHRFAKNWTNWLWNSIYRYSAGYGEKPHYILAWWAIIITLFGTIYWLSGGLHRAGESVSILDSYYFSVVTFTTLGFGDIQPAASMDYIKVCAMTEALLGTMLMALFILTFGRKMMR